MPTDPPPRKLAGPVLALLGVFTHGSTGPWALVLGLEWMADRRRRPHSPAADAVSVWLGGTLGAYWLLVSLTAVPFHFPGLLPVVVIYWLAFAVWLVVRLFTRWRDIAADRRRHPAP